MIFIVDPQFGSNICFKPKKPIIDAAMLIDGTIIILGEILYALKYESNEFQILKEMQFEACAIQQISTFGQYYAHNTTLFIYSLLENCLFY